jgi:hypothetical protein
MKVAAFREDIMLRRRELAAPVRRLVALGVRKVGPPPVLRAVLPEDRKPREAQRLGVPLVQHPPLGPQQRTLPPPDAATPGMRPLANEQRQPPMLPVNKPTTKDDRVREALVTPPVATST